MTQQLHDGMPQPHTLPTLDTLVAHKETLQIVFLLVVTIAQLKIHITIIVFIKY